MAVAVDWLKIKNEYICGGGSYRKLAEKYGVSVSAIKRRAAAGKWTANRARTEPQVHQKTVQKVIERTANQEADRIVRMLAVSDKLLDKLNQAVDELDRQTAKRVVKTKEIRYGDEDAKGKPVREVICENTEIVDIDGLPIDRLGLRQLAAALKDLQAVATGSANPEDSAALKEARKLLGGVDSAID